MAGRQDARRGSDPAEERPLKRNFGHVDDLVAAILAALDNPAMRGKLANIAMDEPVDTAAVAAHLEATQGLGSNRIAKTAWKLSLKCSRLDSMASATGTT